MKKIKPKHDYAVVMTCKGMLEAANAFLNALDYYENPVDLHLIAKEKIKDWVEEKVIKKEKKLIPSVFLWNLDYCNEQFPVPDERKSGWRVRFYRYKMAEHLADKYKAILIVDADMLLLNNIMKYFEVAETSNKIILPWNSWGRSIEDSVDNIEALRGASSPPYHNMPLFINSKKWKGFLHKVFENGLTNSYGDMVNVSRTIITEDLIDDVFPLCNNFWILSTFYVAPIRKGNLKGKDYFWILEHRMNMIHRRWWIPSYCKKFVDAIKGEPLTKVGKNNLKLVWDKYKFFNTKCKVKIPFDYEWYESKKS